VEIEFGDINYHSSQKTGMNGIFCAVSLFSLIRTLFPFDPAKARPIVWKSAQQPIAAAPRGF
jgi:hypothetical protein